MTADRDLPEGMEWETWTYMGRRGGRPSTPLAHRWLTGKGEKLVYAVKRGDSFVVGGLYSLPVERVGGHVNVIFARAAYQHITPSEEERQTWWAQDQAAVTTDRQTKLEARMAKENPLGDAIDRLAQVYAKTPWPDKAALLAYLTSRITKGNY